MLLCTAYTTLDIVRVDDIHVIGKYLLAEKCPWSYKAREAAHLNGHRELLQWLIDNGCPSLAEYKQRCNAVVEESANSVKDTA
jgi:hypothetical protein